MSDLTEYTAAYEALVAAQRRHKTSPNETATEALRAAGERLRAAEGPLADQIDTVWAANLAAVQDARHAVTEALQARRDAETEIARSALQRDPLRPVLNADELARSADALAVWEQARADLATAERAFKDGVTPEQLTALGA